MNKRVAMDFREGKELGEYDPSTTERLLEELCESFGTELLPAFVNPYNRTKLVRRTRPIEVKHLNGKRRLLQFQQTRFSPLACVGHYHTNWLDVYRENRYNTRPRPRRKPECFTSGHALAEIKKAHDGESLDQFKCVTDPRYTSEHLALHRWPKQIYIAVYDNPDDVDSETPFLIHDFDPSDKLPHLHITFHIEPRFVIGHTSENPAKLQDKLRFDYKADAQNHHDNVEEALDSYPLDNLKSPEHYVNGFTCSLSHEIKIPSHIPRPQSVGFIHKYLKSLCQGRTF